MSRLEANREDLFAEATALVQRVELRKRTGSVRGELLDDTVLLGTRKDRSLSLYLAPEDVWHFDPENRLRRAFHATALYRSAADGRLARLERVRTATESILARTDLTDSEQLELLESLRGRLRTLLSQLHGQDLVLTRHHPMEAGPGTLIDSISARIETIAATPIQVAPPVR